MVYIAPLVLVCAAVLVAYLHYRRTKPPPSIAEVLKGGGLYPIPIPLGWKIIDGSLEELDIPKIPGDPFHRILSKGELLVSEIEHPDQTELMMLRQYPFPDPLTPTALNWYINVVMDLNLNEGFDAKLTTRRIGRCALSDEPCGKIVVERRAPADARLEVRWLVRDKTRQGWELVYLVRRERLSAWAPLFAEIDTPPATRTSEIVC